MFSRQTEGFNWDEVWVEFLDWNFANEDEIATPVLRSPCGLDRILQVGGADRNQVRRVNDKLAITVPSSTRPPEVEIRRFHVSLAAESKFNG